MDNSYSDPHANKTVPKIPSMLSRMNGSRKVKFYPHDDGSVTIVTRESGKMLHTQESADNYYRSLLRRGWR